MLIYGKEKNKIFTNHTSSFLELFDSKRKSRFLKLLFRRAKKIIGPSRELADKSRIFFGKSREDVYYIPNGVNVKFFYPINDKQKNNIKNIFLESHGYDKDRTIILCPRRLEPKNGVEFLISAIPSVIKRNPKILFLIAGNDVDKQYSDSIRNLIKELNISGFIDLLGPISNKNMVDYYQISDIVVLPSLMEATSIAGLEAMACGVSVIGTNVGGIPEIVSDGVNGIIVPKKDSSVISAAIIKLLSNRNLLRKFSKASREIAVNKFSWLTITKETVKVYKSVKNE